MRPRKGVHVGALVGSPEEEESRPNLRLYIVGLIVLVLFGVLGLRLWTLQVVEGKTYAAAVTRNEVRVVSIPAPRGEIVDRDGTVLVTNIPQEEILLSQSEAAQNPAIIGMVAALVGETPAQVKTAVNNKQYSPYEPIPVAVGVSTATVQFLQTHQSEYPGVSAQTVTQRSYPQGGTIGTHVLGFSGNITPSFLAAHPNDGYTQGSQIGLSGIEAQYEQYLRGTAGRQALAVDVHGDVVGTLSTTAPKSGDTVVLNLDAGLQEEVQNDLQQQILSDRQTVDAVDGRIPPAPNGAVIVHEPTERPGAGDGVVPDVRPGRVGRRHLRRPTTPPCRPARPRTTGPSRGCTRRGRPSSSSPRRRRCRTGSSRRPRRTTTPAVSGSRGVPRRV